MQKNNQPGARCRCPLLLSDKPVRLARCLLATGIAPVAESRARATARNPGAIPMQRYSGGLSARRRPLRNGRQQRGVSSRYRSSAARLEKDRPPAPAAAFTMASASDLHTMRVCGEWEGPAQRSRWLSPFRVGASMPTTTEGVLFSRSRKLWESCSDGGGPDRLEDSVTPATTISVAIVAAMATGSLEGRAPHSAPPPMIAAAARGRVATRSGPTARARVPRPVAASMPPAIQSTSTTSRCG
jgi:hypothetical protein